MDVMIDLEALGKNAGSAVTELAAVSFHLASGEIDSTFSRLIDPLPTSPPFTCDLDTLEWHRTKGTWPRPTPSPVGEVLITEAIPDFRDWFNSMQPVETVWSWGWDYDRTILETAFVLTGSGPLPWQYHRGACARSVWRAAFPGVKRPARPHTALDDAKAAVGDLRAALSRFNA